MITKYKNQVGEDNFENISYGDFDPISHHQFGKVFFSIINN